MADSSYVVIVGCGRLGSLLAERLSEQGNSVVVVDEREKALDDLSPRFGGIKIVGDAVEPGVLKRAGIDKADYVFATSEDDNTNLMVAQVAKGVFRVPHVTARVYDPKRHELYRALDIDTICPTELSARVFLDDLGVRSDPISCASS